MVSLLLIVLLLVGCVATPPVVIVHDVPIVVVPETEVEAVEEASVPEAKRKRVVKPAPVPVPAEAKPLPPCESAPGDKKTAILQKLECLKQTADIPVVKPIKP